MQGFGVFERRQERPAGPGLENVVEQLDRLAPGPHGLTLSAPKRIAALALYIRATRGLETEAALRRAMRTLAGRLASTPAAVKKVASEARAILQFGLADFAPAAGASADQILMEITAALGRLNLRAVTRVRACAYGGHRGGRRAGPRLRAAEAAIMGLLERAAAGDAEARAELTDIEALIRTAVA